MILYLAQRRLGLSVDAWRALPWWQTRLFRDGFEAEGLLTRGEVREMVEPEALGTNVQRVMVGS